MFSGKVGVFGQSGCIRTRWLYWGKGDVFWQKWLYSDKLVVIGQSNCIRAKWLYSGESGYIRAKLLYRANWLCFGKIGSIWAYSLEMVKICCISADWWHSGRVVLSEQK